MQPLYPFSPCPSHSLIITILSSIGPSAFTSTCRKVYVAFCVWPIFSILTSATSVLLKLSECWPSLWQRLHCTYKLQFPEPSHVSAHLGEFPPPATVNTVGQVLPPHADSHTEKEDSWCGMRPIYFQISGSSIVFFMMVLQFELLKPFYLYFKMQYYHVGNFYEINKKNKKCFSKGRINLKITVIAIILYTKHVTL